MFTECVYDICQTRQTNDVIGCGVARNGTKQ